MATMVPAKKNATYIFYGALVSQADTKLLKSGPTLAAGDFKTSLDGAAAGNLGTLPTNTPGTQFMKFTLANTETNGDNATVMCVDAAGAEWCDQCINIQTAARQIEDLAYPATSGRSLVVDANGLADATVVKLGPTGAGTAQTARDVGAQLDATTSSRMATFTLPANFAALSISGGGLVDILQTAADKVWSTAARTLTAFGFSVTVGTNSDKTGYALSSAGIQAIWDFATALLTAAGSIGKLLVDNVNATISSRLATAGYTVPPTAVQNADALLARNQAGGSTGPADQSVSAAMAGGFMKIDITAGILTVQNGDGTTAFTRTLTRAALNAIINAV